MIWLVVNGFMKNQKFDALAQMFSAAAESASLELKTVTNAELLANTKQVLQGPEAVVFWDKDIWLARYLEIQGIPVFNSSHCIEVCDDKRKTHLCLMQKRLPSPETVFAPMTYAKTGFENMDFLRRVGKQLGFPMVVKEAFGSFGEQVYLAENEEELYRIVETCAVTELLFQRYIRESRGRDVRIQVVGGRVAAAMYRHSTTDFRANITAGGKMEPYVPDERECALALSAAAAVGADFAGVDLLFGKEGPVLCEVNSNAHFKNLFDCTGVDLAVRILRYVSKKTEGR